MKNYTILATIELTVAADQDDALRNILGKIDSLLTEYQTREAEIVHATTIKSEIINQY